MTNVIIAILRLRTLKIHKFPYPQEKITPKFQVANIPTLIVVNSAKCRPTYRCSKVLYVYSLVSVD